MIPKRGLVLHQRVLKIDSIQKLIITLYGIAFLIVFFPSYDVLALQKNVHRFLRSNNQLLRTPGQYYPNV